MLLRVWGVSTWKKGEAPSPAFFGLFFNSLYVNFGLICLCFWALHLQQFGGFCRPKFGDPLVIVICWKHFRGVCEIFLGKYVCEIFITLVSPFARTLLLVELDSSDVPQLLGERGKNRLCLVYLWFVHFCFIRCSFF